MIVIPSSQIQDKTWRKNQIWYINGKHNECEIYQRKLIEEITNQTCYKSNIRFNHVSKEMVEKSNPMKMVDGFDWTEDFDGKIHKNNTDYYFNMKFICDSGGSQTRSLREVYHLIETQLEHILLFDKKNTYFINILDGDICFSHMNKFEYLLCKPNYAMIRPYVYVGDMKGFQEWWRSTNGTTETSG
jgi:hypothetical protein